VGGVLEPKHQLIGRRLTDKKDAHPLDRPITSPSPEPVFTASNIRYEVAARTRAIAPGGIGAMQLLVRKLGLA